MAKIRLNQGMRAELKKYAQTLISFPEDEAKLNKLYNKAAGVVTLLVTKTIPYGDLEILAKYGYAEQTDYFTVKHNVYNQEVAFNFKTGTGPLYKRYGYGLLATEQEYEVVKEWYDANEELKELGKLLAHIRQLASSACPDLKRRRKLFL